MKPKQNRCVEETKKFRLFYLIKVIYIVKFRRQSVWLSNSTHWHPQKTVQHIEKYTVERLFVTSAKRVKGHVFSLFINKQRSCGNIKPVHFIGRCILSNVCAHLIIVKYLFSICYHQSIIIISFCSLLWVFSASDISLPLVDPFLSPA